MHLQDNTVRHGHLAIPPTRVPWQDTLISCDRATGKGIMLPFSTAYYHPSNRNSTQTNTGSEGNDGGSVLGPLWTARRFTLPFDPTSWWWSDDGNEGYDTMRAVTASSGQIGFSPWYPHYTQGPLLWLQPEFADDYNSLEEISVEPDTTVIFRGMCSKTIDTSHGRVEVLALTMYTREEPSEDKADRRGEEESGENDESDGSMKNDDGSAAGEEEV